MVPSRWTSTNPQAVCTEAGSYLRPIDSCITQLKAQGPSRTCNESKEEEEEGAFVLPRPAASTDHVLKRRTPPSYRRPPNAHGMPLDIHKT